MTCVERTNAYSKQFIRFNRGIRDHILYHNGFTILSHNPIFISTHTHIF